MLIFYSGQLEVGECFKFNENGEWFIVYEKTDTELVIGTLINRSFRRRIPLDRLLFNYRMLDPNIFPFD